MPAMSASASALVASLGLPLAAAEGAMLMPLLLLLPQE